MLQKITGELKVLRDGRLLEHVPGVRCCRTRGGFVDVSLVEFPKGGRPVDHALVGDRLSKVLACRLQALELPESVGCRIKLQSGTARLIDHRLHGRILNRGGVVTVLGDGFFKRIDHGGIVFALELDLAQARQRGDIAGVVLEHPLVALGSLFPFVLAQACIGLLELRRNLLGEVGVVHLGLAGGDNQHGGEGKTKGTFHIDRHRGGSGARARARACGSRPIITFCQIRSDITNNQSLVTC